MYRLGWPGAQALGRLGIPLLVKVMVRFDREAHVFIGTSKDLPGLVVEAESLDDMVHEVRDLLPAMLEAEHFARHGNLTTRLSYTDAAVACA